MGTLFSSERSEEKPTRFQNRGFLQEPKPIQTYPQHQGFIHEAAKPAPRQIHSSNSHRIVPSRLRVITKEPISNLKEFIRTNNSWDYSSEVFNVTPLPEYHHEYVTIKTLFTNTTKKGLVQILAIYKIENPYLIGRYMLKKKEYITMYGHVNEEFLFHGTDSSNVDKICETNFNWRLCGNKIGHRYGKGVSFSPISYYASNYCDKKSMTKEMLVAKVLVAKECIGEENMDIPPYFSLRRKLRFDTTVKEDRRVIVKYYDDEYYPAYKITFTVKYGYYNNNKNKNRHYYY